VFSFWFFGGSADGDAVLEFWSAKEDFFECLVSTLEVVDKLYKGQPMDENQRNSMAQTIAGMIQVDPLKGTNLVNLSVSGPDPVEITNIANIVAEIYMGKSLRDKVDDYKNASSWIDERISDTIVKMKKARSLSKERTLAS